MIAMKVLSCAVVLALATATASADGKAPVADIDKLMDKQAAAMIADDAKALEATLAKDGFASTGGRPTPGDVSLPRSIGMGVASVAFGAKAIAWRGDWGWIVVDAKIGFWPHPEGMVPGKPTSEQMPPPVVQHWLELVVRDGKELKTRALIVTSTTADSSLRGYNYIEKRPAVAKPSALVALLAQPVALGKLLAKDDAVAIIGTSPRDRALGAAAGKKLLAGWANLGLAIVEPDRTESSSDQSGPPAELAFGDVHVAWAELRMRKKIPLTAFVIAQVNGDKIEVLAASYISGED
jgi:hypothetical protein